MRDGEPVFERAFDTRSLGKELLDALSEHGPYDLVYGPSGYGVPLVAAADIDERHLAEMVLVRKEETRADAGVGGMRSLLRALAASGLPVVFGPGVIHLPTVPPHRKYNRIDLGTADKVCAAAYAIVDQSRRHAISVRETSMLLVELGGAFSAVLAIAGGQIVDGAGGSSGPPGVRAAGALDGEVAYLLGASLRKDTLFSGGAILPSDPPGYVDLEALWSEPAHADGWLALLEGAAKAVRALLVSVPAPREIVVSGRLARLRPLLDTLTTMLGDVAPLVSPIPGSTSVAAHGAALLADGLAGGIHSDLAEVMRLRESSGSALDHLRVAGAAEIELG